MEESIKDRLLIYIDFKGISIRNFEELCGLSNGFVSKTGDSIQKRNVEKISTKCPDLNIEWLKIGIGDMLKSECKSTVHGNGNTSVAGNGNQITHTDVAGLIELQKGYQEILRKKDEQIDRLLTMIEKKK